MVLFSLPQALSRSSGTLPPPPPTQFPVLPAPARSLGGGSAPLAPPAVIAAQAAASAVLATGVRTTARAQPRHPQRPPWVGVAPRRRPRLVYSASLPTPTAPPGRECALTSQFAATTGRPNPATGIIRLAATIPRYRIILAGHRVTRGFVGRVCRPKLRWIPTVQSGLDPRFALLPVRLHRPPQRLRPRRQLGSPQRPPWVGAAPQRLRPRRQLGSPQRAGAAPQRLRPRRQLGSPRRHSKTSRRHQLGDQARVHLPRLRHLGSRHNSQRSPRREQSPW